MKDLNVIVSIKNTVTLICFTVLAIVFHHWWIVLFSALFFSSVETKLIDINKNNKGSD